jgi:hypothetical protein
VSFDRKLETKEATEAFRQMQIAEYKGYAEQRDGDDGWALEQADMFRDARLESIGDCFAVCRDSAWDLWKAAPKIAEVVFPGLKIDHLPGPKFDPSKHQLLNIACWDENNKVGVCCYLLCLHGYVRWQDQEEVFGGFDT